MAYGKAIACDEDRAEDTARLVWCLACREILPPPALALGHAHAFQNVSPNKNLAEALPVDLRCAGNGPKSKVSATCLTRNSGMSACPSALAAVESRTGAVA